MIIKLISFIIIVLIKIFLIKNEDKIVKSLIFLEKNSFKVYLYILLLVLCVVFFYTSILFFAKDFTCLIIIYLFNNLVLVLMMKYLLLKIYYYYYNETIKFGNFSLHRFRIKISRQCVLFLSDVDKNFSTNFLESNLGEQNRKLLVNILNFCILITCGIFTYMVVYFVYSIIYFYIFIMEDKNDGLVNDSFFREPISLTIEGKKKLMDYGRYLINTNRKKPIIKPYRDFQYLNHECY